MRFSGHFESADDRFFNVLQRMSPGHEFVGGLAIVAHGFLGQTVGDELLAPLTQFLATSESAGRMAGWVPHRPSEAAIRAMRCEAVLSVIACSAEIDESVARTVPLALLWQLPRLANDLAMLERPYAWSEVRHVPELAAAYSTTAEEAFAQLSVQWQGLLGITDPVFRRVLYELELPPRWTKMQFALGGLAIGAQRNPAEMMLRKARQVLRDMPEARRDEVIHAVTAGIRVEAPVSRRPPAKPTVTSPESGRIIPAYNAEGRVAGGVEFDPDGRANLHLTEGSDFVASSMMAGMIMAQWLGAVDRAVFSRWAGLPAATWTTAHTQLFALVFVHVMREGTIAGEAFSGVAPLQPLPRPLTSEVRAICNQIFSIPTVQGSAAEAHPVVAPEVSVATTDRSQELAQLAERYAAWLHNSGLRYFILGDLAQGVERSAIRAVLVRGGMFEGIIDGYIESVDQDYQNFSASGKQSSADGSKSLIAALERAAQTGATEDDLARMLGNTLKTNHEQALAVLFYIAEVHGIRITTKK